MSRASSGPPCRIAPRVAGTFRLVIADTAWMAPDPETRPDIAYYASGGLQSRGFTLDGEMHGTWEFYRKDGSLMRTGAFDRGRLVKATDFSQDGPR